MRAGAQAIDQYLRAGDDAIRIMTAQDSTLQTVLERITTVEELTIASANDTLSTSAREAIAVELEEIRSQLVELANAQLAGRSLFGGFQSSAVDDSGASVTLTGDAGQIQRRIADDQVLTVNVGADELFGFALGRNIFDILDDVVVDTRAGDVTTLGNVRLDELKTSRDAVNTGLGVLGSSSARVETTMDGLLASRDSLNASVSELVNVDMAEATIDFSEANLAYQAALAVTAQINQVSLLNYL